jgi:hypothetical protein
VVSPPKPAFVAVVTATPTELVKIRRTATLDGGGRRFVSSARGGAAAAVFHTRSCPRRITRNNLAYFTWHILYFANF